jgi:hypothetical protein
MSSYVGPFKVLGPDALYSAQANIGTSVSQMSPAELVGGGCVVKADDDNLGSIWVGTAGVTTSTGYRLKGGQSVPVSAKNANQIYAIASQASQKLYLLGG